VALIGKVYCKVDARPHSIEVGDLLTTSSTPGHAMKATHPADTYGTVIGKALAPMQSGIGLLPILVCLQCASRTNVATYLELGRLGRG